MSGVKRRFQHKTGIEYFDTAVDLDLEIWDFLKFEFKKKTKKEAMQQGMDELPGGAIPYRYWDTHGKVIHNYAWTIILYVREMFQIPQPQNEEELRAKKKAAKQAINYCYVLQDALRMTGEELGTINANKLDRIIASIDKEIKLLEGVKEKSKVKSNGSTRTK